MFNNCLKLCILYIYQKKQHKKRYCVNKLPGINLKYVKKINRKKDIEQKRFQV